MFGSKLVAVLLSTAALALAADPQLDIAAVADAGPPPQPSIATNVHDQQVAYDATSASAAAAATQSAQAFDTEAVGSTAASPNTGSKVKRAACDPLQLGKGPVPSPDTASAFLAYPSFANSASAAPAPTGYNLAFQNLQAENNALGYMGFSLLDTYDTDLCAKKCNAIYGCNAINIAFERSPSKSPSPKGGACDQPPSTTLIKCVFWGGPVTTANAVNRGQYRNEFQVVIAGSNGYVNKSSDIVPGYGPGNYLDGKVISAPNDCNDASTFISYQYWNDGKPFDTARCAAACTAQTQTNPATPCRFFNTYIINKNNAAQGQYCALYTQQWANSYATSKQVTFNGATYTTSYSYSYTVNDYSYTCVKNAFGCPNVGQCYSYQNCATTPAMKITNSAVPVYTVSGSEARPLPEWLIRQRKRSLKNDPEFANRVELLQDFGFDEASQCVRVSDDGDWVMSTGTYKPQIHAHYLPHLSLSFARHTNTLNETFRLLSSDYTKSVHLQADRVIEFHTAGGLHHATRIPRYGRDLVYDKRSAECLVPSVGVNADGLGEAFRLNLEVGRFMRSYEIDVGGDDLLAPGSLQGGIEAGAVNTGAIAEESHNLLAFGTSLGTVEFWDSRSRNRVGILSAPNDAFEGRAQVTALTFPRSGLNLAVGNSNGLVHLYDLRSPTPLLKKDQGYGFAIKNIIYLENASSARGQVTEPKILTADKRIIKIWDPTNGTPWTSVEPAVDLNHVEWVKDSGMLLTANEGKQQHSFFIPQLGPAPKWCAFLDNIVEEMAEDPNDPNAFGAGAAGQVYDNFKFLTTAQLKTLSLDHLIGTTSLLRPYMHGYFVAQKLYEEAKLISNPDMWQEQRAKSIAEKINKERESRIRGNKKVSVKVNQALAEKMRAREDEKERRRAKRVLKKGGDDDMLHTSTVEAPAVEAPAGLLGDSRFARLFQDEDFEVDEQSHEFRAINPSTNPTKIPKGLTAAEQEALDSARGSDSDSDSNSDSDVDEKPRKTPADTRISSSSYRKAGHNNPMLPNQNQSQPQKRTPQMQISSSNKPRTPKADKSFATRVSKLKHTAPKQSNTTVVGEREITFAPEVKKKKIDSSKAKGERHDRRREGNIRSASGNAFRGM